MCARQEADLRIFNQQLPVTYQGCQYALRLSTGNKESIAGIVHYLAIYQNIARLPSVDKIDQTIIHNSHRARGKLSLSVEKDLVEKVTMLLNF